MFGIPLVPEFQISWNFKIGHLFQATPISTFECSWSYGPPIEMETVSEVSLRPQINLSKISS